MARGQRKSFEERIQSLDVQIQKEQDRLDALLLEKEELLTRKRESELKELYEVMAEHNLEADEVVAMIQEACSVDKTA